MTAPDSSPPQLLPRQPNKSVSVRAVKEFFESKASQNRSAPPVPHPEAAAIAKGASARKQVNRTQPPTLPPFQSRDEASRSTCIPSPTSRIVVRSDEEPFLPSPSPEASIQPEPLQQNGSLTCSKTDLPAPNVVVRKATTCQDSPVRDDHSSSDTSAARTRRRRSTNIFEMAPRDANPSSFEQRNIDHSSKLDEDSNTPLITPEHTDKTGDRHTSDETVRRRPTYESMSTAESDEGAFEEAPTAYSRTRRSKHNPNVRAAIEEEYESTAKQIRRHKSRSAPLNNKGTSAKQRKRPKSRKSSATDVDQDPNANNGSENVNVLNVTADVTFKTFSHNGSSSTPISSCRSTAPGPIPRADVGLQPIDRDVHDVDWRSGYGRRKTEDFGYPGARIKPRRTYRAYEPLQDPGNWTKRACGHFSYITTTESREGASKQLCYQCRTQSSPSVPQSARLQQARKPVATVSSSSSWSMLEDASDTGCHSSRRRKHFSECSPVDKRNETFAEDLGYIIDAILEEHTDTLQGVINNIKNSQPSLVKPRGVSKDHVQRCQTEGICTNPCHTPCRPSCTRQTAFQPCQPVCRSVCRPAQQVCELTPPCPSIPPRAAEKLNVGAPRQLAPNFSDSRTSLRKSIMTLPDLIDLVNSAADDIGVDLDRRPSAKDDELFRDAPVQSSTTLSVSSRHSIPTVLEDVASEETAPAQDSWIEQTRRHLTELPTA